VLLPAPARRPPLMVGATGPRMLAATLPRVDAWNSPPRRRVEHLVRPLRQHARGLRDGEPRHRRGGGARWSGPGRDRAQRVRAGRPRPDGRRAPGSRGRDALEGSAEAIAASLGDLARAGADEAILVVSPITERSIRARGDALAALDR
jgi:alkanesulfonate monooxygenase SsuD/methylene tetrahydromethanopterin reductase-like flavin-dependent oxidoreductase (luciferase family)